MLITRPEYDPQITVLPDGTADFVAALAEGATLAMAHDRAAMKIAPISISRKRSSLLLDGAAITHITPEIRL